MWSCFLFIRVGFRVGYVEGFFQQVEVIFSLVLFRGSVLVFIILELSILRQVRFKLMRVGKRIDFFGDFEFQRELFFRYEVCFLFIFIFSEVREFCEGSIFFSQYFIEFRDRDSILVSFGLQGRVSCCGGVIEVCYLVYRYDLVQRLEDRLQRELYFYYVLGVKRDICQVLFYCVFLRILRGRYQQFYVVGRVIEVQGLRFLFKVIKVVRGRGRMGTFFLGLCVQ